MKLKEIKPGMVIHCKTEIEAWYLLEHLSKLGFVWLSSRNLLDDTNYRTHGNETCYEFIRDSEKRIAFGSYEFYEDNKRDIVEFSSLIIEEKTYEDGLNEAWECAKKIALESFSYKDALTDEELKKAFGTFDLEKIMTNNVLDVIAKLEAYEAEKQIKVGDVVEYFTAVSNPHFGIYLSETMDEHWVLSPHCKAPQSLEKKTGWQFKKTGKHIDISSILAEIGKE